MKRTPANFKDLTGQRFGRLFVISRWGEDIWGQATWICLCDCGEHIVTKGSSLRRDKSRSCGCLQRELTAAKNYTHGLSKTLLYLVWNGMISRCTNKNQSHYERYGKRGIIVCEEWKRSFIIFHKWAITNGYKRGLQIDRRNNNAGYFPDNCRFVTAEINGNNTRQSRKWIVFNKSFLSATQAGIFYGVNKRTIRNWCLGDKQRGTLPRQNCSASRLYEGIQTNANIF